MVSGNRTLAGQLYRAWFVACVIIASCPLAAAFGQALPPAETFPGGFLEQATSTQVRPLLSASQLQLLLPATRGPFVFPDPYNTRGIRLTDASDCVGSTDCVNGVGSAYWRRINNHVGSDTMLIVLGLDRARGGAGPTLFRYNKGTDAVTNLGPLFDSTSPLSWATGDMWYFSATQPTTLYVNDGPRLLRYDVMIKTSVTVFDVSTQPAPIGPHTIIWKMHSSNDDRVHSATLKDAATLADLGCVAYREDTKQFVYVPQHGFLYDECQIDKSGRWLLIKEKLYASTPDVDNRMIDLTTGVETDLLYQNGAGVQSDNGFGYMVAADNWDSLLNAIRLWKFGTSPLGPGTVVYDAPQGIPHSVQHVSHANANPTLPPEQQYVCGSGANSTNGPRVNEVVCFFLDGSFRVLVVAPVMTDMNATGGGDAYSKLPKGNLDVTGQYFIWASNVGTSRLDAFLVKVPAHVLTNLRDTTPPTVSITSPAAGVTVAGTVTIAVSATDNVGVVGVQLKLDGLNLGAELTAAPYAVSWDTIAASNGTHTLTAVARDAAGNLSTSVGVSLTVSNAIVDPQRLAVTPSSITSSSATQATLSWDPNTDPDLAGYKLYYGTSSRSYQFSVDVGNVTSYRLSGLLDGQIYYLATTAYNSKRIESNFSNEVSTAIADVTPPVLSAVAASNMTSSAATIGWSTDKLSDSQVEYGLTPSYGSVTTFNTSLVTAHSQALSGLVAGTLYHYRVKSKDKAGNLATSADFTLTTLDAVDTTPPAVSMTAPTSGATVSGTVTVAASATDNVGVVGVQFKLDGANLGAEVTAAPYMISWNTTNAANGAHSLTAVARDATGNVTTSSVVSVTVANATVSITAPLNGAQLTDPTQVTVLATSGVGLSAIQIYSDSSLLGTVSCTGNSCSYTANWNTNGLATGNHSLYAVATDTFGNSSYSTAIFVSK